LLIYNAGKYAIDLDFTTFKKQKAIPILPTTSRSIFYIHTQNRSFCGFISKHGRDGVELVKKQSCDSNTESRHENVVGNGGTAPSILDIGN
jgi:hypothetical protein